MVSTVPFPTVHDDEAPTFTTGSGELEFHRGSATDTSTGEAVYLGNINGLSSPRVALDAQRRVLTATSEGEITRVIDLASTRVVCRAAGALRSLSPKGRYVVAGDHVIDVASGKSQPVGAGRGPITFSPSERYATINGALVDLELRTSVLVPGAATLCTFSPDETLVACSSSPSCSPAWRCLR